MKKKTTENFLSFYTSRNPGNFFDSPRSENVTEPPLWTPGAPARGGGIRAPQRGGLYRGRPPYSKPAPLPFIFYVIPYGHTE